jgi:hypothetical protein
MQRASARCIAGQYTGLAQKAAEKRISSTDLIAGRTPNLDSWLRYTLPLTYPQRCFDFLAICSGRGRRKGATANASQAFFRRWATRPPRHPQWMGTLLRSVLSLEASDRTPHDLMRSFMRLAIRKYKRFRGHTKAVWTGCGWLRALKRRNPNLFAHWSGIEPAVG